MFIRSIREGMRRAARRFRLVLLIYIVNLLAAFALVLPVYYALRRAVSTSGFSVELTEGFDFVLWADILESAGTMFRSSFMQIAWVLPVFLLWKVASTVGLVHALRGANAAGHNNFWFGVGRYTSKALLLATLFLIPSAILCGLTLMFSQVVHSLLWPGEVGGFWTYAVLAPLLLLSVLALFNLMQTYGRIALLLEERSVISAWRTGLAWPFKHPTSLWLYAFWFFIGAGLLLLPTLASVNVSTKTAGTIWLLFLFQQLVLLARAWVNATWVGSEVAFFESVRQRQASAHAFTDAPTPAFTPTSLPAFAPATTPVPMHVPPSTPPEVTQQEQATDDPQQSPKSPEESEVLGPKSEVETKDMC